MWSVFYFFIENIDVTYVNSKNYKLDKSKVNDLFTCTINIQNIRCACAIDNAGEMNLPACGLARALLWGWNCQDCIWPKFRSPNFFLSKIWLHQSLDIMVSYHHVQYQKKLMIQSWENLVRDRQTGRRMDGWTGRWTDRPTYGWTEGQMDGWTDAPTDGQRDRRTDRPKDGQTTGWTDQWSERWTNGQTDQWTDG